MELSAGVELRTVIRGGSIFFSAPVLAVAGSSGFAGGDGLTEGTCSEGRSPALSWSAADDADAAACSTRPADADVAVAGSTVAESRTAAIGLWLIGATGDGLVTTPSEITSNGSAAIWPVAATPPLGAVSAG